MELMKCRVCGRELPADKFYKISPTKNWYRRECKECTSNRHKREEEASRQALREYNRDYYRRNKERVDKLNAEWKKANPEKRHKTALSYYYRLQAEAIEAYGGVVCKSCGIDEPFVLTIDHVENNGNQHRKEIGSTGGHKFYKWLKDNGYPDGFQVLCMNCNHAKYRNGGTIPESLKGRCNDHPR